MDVLPSSFLLATGDWGSSAARPSQQPNWSHIKAIQCTKCFWWLSVLLCTQRCRPLCAGGTQRGPQNESWEALVSPRLVCVRLTRNTHVWKQIPSKRYILFLQYCTDSPMCRPSSPGLSFWRPRNTGFQTIPSVKSGLYGLQRRGPLTFTLALFFKLRWIDYFKLLLFVLSKSY